MKEEVIAGTEQGASASRFSDPSEMTAESIETLRTDVLSIRPSKQSRRQIFNRVDVIPGVDCDNFDISWSKSVSDWYDAIGCAESVNIEQLENSGLQRGFSATSVESAKASGPIVMVRLDTRAIRCSNTNNTALFNTILAVCLHSSCQLIPASPQSLCRVLPHLVDKNGALAEVFGGPNSEITFCSPVRFCPHDDGFQYAMGIRVGQRVHPPELVHQYALLNAGDVRLLFRGAI